MSGSMFTPDAPQMDPKLAEMLDTPEGRQIAAMLATNTASQAQQRQNPYDTMTKMAMDRYKQQSQQMIAPPAMRPQVQRGQQVNMLNPLEELLKMQQMQQVRQRPQSLL